MGKLFDTLKKRTIKVYMDIEIVIPAFIALIAYLFVLELSITIFGNIYAGCVGSNLFTFVTSPINYCENLYSSSPITSLYYNCFLFIAIIGIFTAYMKLFALNKRFSLISVLFSAVLSTYIFSAITWSVIGQPGEGTSIISFNLLVFLIIGIIWDFATSKKIGIREYTANMENKRYIKKIAAYLKIPLNRYIDYLYKNRLKTRALVSTFLIALLAFLIFGFFILGNVSYRNHLSGGFIFIAVLYALDWIKITNRKLISILTILIFIFIIFSIGIAIYSHNTRVIVGLVKVIQHNPAGKSIMLNTYTGFAILPNSTTTLNLSCNSDRNLALENISLNDSNFGIVSIWPSLPQNLSRNCSSDFTIKLKAPNFPTTANISVVETIERK